MSITIMEKPDSVSFDEIHNILWSAHESTREKGLHFHTAEWQGEEIKAYLDQHEGTCLVALDGNTVVGTMSYFIESRQERFFKGPFLKLVLIGNLPEYKGKHIYTMLYNSAFDYAKSHGLDGLSIGTAEKNNTMIAINRKLGFIFTRCYYSKNMNCFCVGGVMPFAGTKHSKIFYSLYFSAQKIKARLNHFLSR